MSGRLRKLWGLTDQAETTKERAAKTQIVYSCQKIGRESFLQDETSPLPSHWKKVDRKNDQEIIHIARGVSRGNGHFWPFLRLLSSADSVGGEGGQGNARSQQLGLGRVCGF